MEENEGFGVFGFPVHCARAPAVSGRAQNASFIYVYIYAFADATYIVLYLCF